jgi:ATP-dependent exoDNAse (exonuclease V) alpha subunit
MVGINHIQRQVSREYREAINDLAQGNGLEGLSRLERLGALQEVEDDRRYLALAADYVTSVKGGKSALIVSPTWREVDLATAEVRARLKQENVLAQKEIAVPVHHPLKWTRAQKRDLRNYTMGMVLTFQRSTKQFDLGETAEVVRVEPDFLKVRRTNGKLIELTKKQADCFDVAKKTEIPVSAGERLLIQANRKRDGLFNGQIVTVKMVKPNGRIVLEDELSLAPDFRAFTYGYCVTSHASQGRTVDHVYVAVDSRSILSANQNQFYVSASRGREQVKVFTDDLDFLREAVTRPAARLSATELIGQSRFASRERVELRESATIRLAP